MFFAASELLGWAVAGQIRSDQISKITGKDQIRSREKIRSDRNLGTRILSDHDKINKINPPLEAAAAGLRKSRAGMSQHRSTGLP